MTKLTRTLFAFVTDILDLDDAVDELTGAHAPTPQPISRADDWWMTPPPEPIIHPPLEGLSGDAVWQQLSDCIEDGSFRMIDIPSNVMRCLEILSQPNFSYSEVEKLISRSPALAASIMSVANSALYNRGMAVNRLSVALPRLGCGKIKAILYFASCEQQVSNHPLFSQVATSIVKHSFAVAGAANHLSTHLDADPDEAFLAGLLHDIGKLAILKALATTHAAAPNVAPDQIGEESYGRIMPELHPKVGRLIAQHWGLTESIQGLVGRDHDWRELPWPAEDDATLRVARVVCLSDYVVRYLGLGQPPPALPLPDYYGALNIRPPWDEHAAELLRTVPDLIDAHHAMSA